MNLTKIKKKHIIWGLILFMVLTGYFWTSYNSKKFSERCPYYKTVFGEDRTLVECNGIIYIYTTNLIENVYNVGDLKHKYVITELYSPTSYKFKDDYIYIYEQSDEFKAKISFIAGDSRDVYEYGELKRIYYNATSASGKIEKKYIINNGDSETEITSIFYNSSTKVPRFIKVNIYTGETERFVTDEEMTSEDRIIFEEISAK